jgi:hypothetical protein
MKGWKMAADVPFSIAESFVLFTARLVQQNNYGYDDGRETMP